MFSGVTNRTYFGEQQTNVMTIMQVGVKTPAVSFIPESLTSVVTKLSGITTISPEVYSLVMLHNNPLNLHGITNTFQNFSSATTVSGQGLDALQHPSEQIIIAGQTIAGLLNLTVGQSYTISSITTSSFSSFVLAGIVRFNSVYDDEIFTTLAWAQFFRPQQNENDISLLRIRYDPQLISEPVLNTLLATDYTVSFHLVNQSMIHGPATNVAVSVYTANGAFLSTNSTDTSGNTSFRLQPGVYKFIIKNGTTVISINKTIIANTNIILPIGPPLQSNTFTLGIRVYENNSLLTGAKIHILSGNGSVFDLVSSNSTLLTGLGVNTYTLSATYNGYNTSTSIYLNKSLFVELNLTFPVIVHAMNASEQPITHISCSFTDLNNKTRIYNYTNCALTVYLPQSDYNVSITSPGYTSLFLLYNVSYHNLNNTLTAVLGNLTASLTFQDISNPSSTTNISLYYKELQSATFVYGGQTSANGQITLTLRPYVPYVVEFNKSETGLASTIILSSIFNLNKIIMLEQNFVFQVTCYVVTPAGVLPINNTFVSITTQNTSISPYTGTTNTSGLVEEGFAVDQILNITATYKTMTKQVFVATVNTKNVSLYFGPITFFVHVQSTTHLPLPDIPVNVYSGNTSFYFRTNQTGEVLGTVPTLATGFQDYTGLYSSNLSRPHYTVVITTTTSSFLTFVFPRTYSGYYYTYNATFLYYVTPQLYLRDINGNPLPNAIFVLQNVTLNTYYSALADGQGIIANLNLSVGSYRVNIEFNGLFFNQLITIGPVGTIYLVIPVATTRLALSVPHINYLGFSGQQITDQFLGQSTSFFIEIIAIVIISTLSILVTLLVSLVNLIIQDNFQELRMLSIVGATFGQIISNLLIQFQKLSILGSLIGLVLGTVITAFVPAFQNVQIVGLVIKPQFSLELTVIYFCLMNILVFVFLCIILLDQKWQTLISTTN